ncbi:MAG TPA: PQQ-dependent sugar dehydrogenase, partial [Marinagarivorans sp.]|nr:PQQ-dependent sugar dehydrogenase [Marinagarivorans sp.]
QLETPQPFDVIKSDLPDKAWHGARAIEIGPDHKLYIPIGAPCNVCDVEDGPFGKIWRMNLDGSGFEPVVKGVRNSVGLAWHPLTRELWFTDNGRDELGDNTPSCELNHAPQAAMHFGFPYCHGGSILDPEWGKGKSCAGYSAPVALLGPHVAPLGLAFYTADQFPSIYKNQLFIAEHGSWNRTQKIGYRISLVTLNGNALVSDTVFADFLQGDTVLGRPVDIAFLKDGSMLVSDDDKGRIYRIRYTGEKPGVIRSLLNSVKAAL